MKKKHSGKDKEGPKNKKDNNGRERLVYEGTIVEPIKNIMLNVLLDHNNQIVLGYISGNMRRNRIRVVQGDRVLVELNDSDSKKGRIVYRISRVSKPNSQAGIEQTADDQQAKKDPASTESLLDTEITNPRSSDLPQSSDQRDNKDTNANKDLG